MSAGRVAVAYSGGRDSTALLHATLVAAAEHGVEVIALHVHHGLSSNADAWLAHCESQCRRWQRAGKRIEFVAHSVGDRPAKGESVEAWARQARYRALRDMALAQNTTLVLLAHHQRDQAETLLLQALRGAGVTGLSGMPRSALRDGITWQRPWLDQPRAAIDAYIGRHRLKHIEDDSNADLRFARNRLRLQVWPALNGAFEQADASLARAAAWAQEASALLDEVAVLDLAATVFDNGLQLEAWLALSSARRSNALRAWLKRVQGAAAPVGLILRLLDELPAQRGARWPLGDAQLRLYRGVLRLEAVAAAPSSVRETCLEIRSVGDHLLVGWGGTLRVERVAEGGVPLTCLAQLELRTRRGGELFKCGPGRPSRGLKRQFQDAGVPAWHRDGPLCYSDDRLVFVPGLGLDARVIGRPDQHLVVLRWLPLCDSG